MALINPLLGSNLASTGFDTTLIPNSVWFNGTDSRMDSPSFSAQSDPTCFTFATWVQILDFSISPAGQYLWSAERTGNYASIGFDANNKLFAYSNPATFRSDMIFRDTGWYHIICSYKGSANTVRMFVNGVEITNSRTNSLATNPEPVAFSHTQRIGAYYVGATGGDLYEANSYLAQTVFLDGFSFQDGDITVSDFLDTFTFGTNGSQFIPKKDSDLATLAGTAGANSYVLDYADSANLGNDISSKNNDFTLTNMSSANQSTSTPSKTYSVFNPIAKRSSAFTLSNGNRTTVTPTFDQWMKTTIPFVMSGSNIIRTQFTFSTLGDGLCGITGSPHTSGTYYTSAAAGRGEVALLGNGALSVDGSFNNTYTSALSNGDIVDVIVNLNVGAVYFAVNGTLLGGATESEIQAGTTTNAAQVGSFVRRVAGEVFNYYVGQYNPSAATIVYNSGQTAFTHSYSSITSLKSLNTADLPAPYYQGIDYFNATLYEGNGTAIGSGGKAVTGVGFKPDFTWIKNRDAADSHILTDVVRGVTKYISSNSTAAEATNTESLSTFDTDGFTVGNLDAVNTNTENYVSWNWLAGGTGSSNTNGSIASTVTVAGAGHLSIGTYTGTGANGTVGHGLGGAPELIFVKNTADNRAWRVLETVANDATKYLTLNTTAASTAGSTMWNNTNPTASVFSVGSDTDTNDLNDTMFFMAFRSIPGVCKVGTYVGNLNADGPYIDIGFTPRWFMLKVTDGINNWGIYDSARNTFNVTNRHLNANGSDVEDTTYSLDFLSNAIKIRGAFQFFNDTGKTYLYIAMADIGGNGTLPPLYGR